MFPNAFRRATMERIQLIRNILETLTSLDPEENNQGPTDEDYIQQLSRF